VIFWLNSGARRNAAQRSSRQLVFVFVFSEIYRPTGGFVGLHRLIPASESPSRHSRTLSPGNRTRANRRNERIIANEKRTGSNGSNGFEFLVADLTFSARMTHAHRFISNPAPHRKFYFEAACVAG
jgi:hypothetical protein